MFDFPFAINRVSSYAGGMGRHAKYTRELVEPLIATCSNNYELAVAIGMGWTGPEVTSPALRVVLRKLGLTHLTGHFRRLTRGGIYPYVAPTMPWGTQVYEHTHKLPKTVLVRGLEKGRRAGRSLQKIADTFGVSVAVLKADMNHHGIPDPSNRTPKYPKELVEPLVGKCTTFYELGKALGMPGGCVAETAKRVTERLGLDTRHFVRKGRRPEVSSLGLHPVGTSMSPTVLRREFLATGVPYKCAICSLLPEWAGKPLVLQIDHINGQRHDNRLSNLRFLCPNCHTQTPTYAGRNGKGPRPPRTSRGIKNKLLQND